MNRQPPPSNGRAAPSKVLVTGATGFAGSHLVRALLRQGADVRALARPSSDRGPFTGLPVEWVIGDITEAAAVREAVRGVARVFHLASLYRDSRADRDAQHRVHVTGTRLLAEAALASPQLTCFVHVSTIGVHGHIAHPPGDEESPFQAGDDYQETKAEAELWLRAFARQTGLPLTVIRPAAIYGPGDRRLLKLFRMAARGWFPVIGNGNNWVHLVHVDDLTSALLLAAQDPRALGEVFICAGPQALRLRAIMALIGQTFGRRVRLIPLPAGPLFALAALCERACLPLRLSPPLYRRRLAFYTKDRAFKTDKIRDRLGFVSRIPAAEGIPALARWYLDAGWLKI